MTYLLIYPAILLLTALGGARFSGKGAGSPEYLCPQQTGLIRAAACVGIIFHHIAQQITSYGIYRDNPVVIFNDTGFWFTSLFFFFSGYGLVTSLYHKPDYLNRFLQKRLPGVLIPFWVINLLGVLLNISAYGIRYRKAEILYLIFGIRLVNSNGWFFVEITLLYLAFYVLFRLIRNRDAALFLLCLFTLAMMAYSFFQGHDPAGAQVHWFRGEWWYNSTVTFIAGLLFARFRCRRKRGLQEGGASAEGIACQGNAPSVRAYAGMVLLSATLCAVSLYLSIFCVRRYGYYQTGAASFIRYSAWITLLSQMAACLFFAAFVAVLHLRLVIGNRILRFVSSLSRELFLVHGYFVTRIFQSVRMSMFLRFAAVLACSIACCAVLTPCVNFLVRQVTTALLRVSGSVKAWQGAAALKKADTRQGKKNWKARIGACAAVGAAALASAAVCRDLIFRTQYAKELETLRTAKTGDQVQWGRYEMDPARPGRERVPWIVIRREGEHVCLLSEYGLAGSCYRQKHEAVSWEESDLRSLLNSTAFTGMFSRYEKMSMVPFAVREGGDTVFGGAGVSDGGKEDLVSLLTAQQARDVFATDAERVLSITESAWHSGTNADRVSHKKVWYERGYCNSWWWLRGSENDRSITAPIVDMYGSVLADTKYVNKPGGAVRPVIWVNCSAR